MELDPIQALAVERCVGDERLVAVTGPAGTGKTTIIKKAYDKLVEQYPPIECEKKNGDKFLIHQVRLCAPTGKAARRMTEATGIPASTIHMLLEYSSPGDPDPKTGKPMMYSFPL